MGKYEICLRQVMVYTYTVEAQDDKEAREEAERLYQEGLTQFAADEWVELISCDSLADPFEDEESAPDPAQTAAEAAGRKWQGNDPDEGDERGLDALHAEWAAERDRVWSEREE